MIIVDRLLAERERAGRPVQVGIVGAGFAGKGLALQLLIAARGMRLACISNRTITEAEAAYRGAGVDSVRTVTNADQLEDAIRKGQYATTSNPMVLCDAPSIDIIMECTGEIEFAAQVAEAAFAAGKHFLGQAELDSTLGPILKVHAERAGVHYGQMDGDQPAWLMNLYRYVQSLGFRPVMCGNIKTLQDCRRTPATQLDFATRHWQRPKFITSFADGTKISQEMASIANGTGFGVTVRGMQGPRCDHVDNAWKLFDHDRLLNGGLVDYILGAQPSFGVFVLGYSDHPLHQRYMKCYKMGDGPFYTFYTPTHLSPLEAVNSIGRVVLAGDVPLQPKGPPVCDVVTIAKRDLRAGEMLDGIGGFLSYGAIENTKTAVQERLLPMGLSEGCRLVRDLPMDRPITFDDVQLPAGRLADRLWREQMAHFGLRSSSSSPATRVAALAG